jgi:hypothetical protein
MVASGGWNGRRKVTGFACCRWWLFMLLRQRRWLGCWCGGEAFGDDGVVQGGRSWWMLEERERRRHAWF